ncbi:MAG: efflux RND transporter permease subunit [Planctomycetota bacterium]|jgi:predicted RND superfamily exporter protein
MPGEPAPHHESKLGSVIADTLLAWPRTVAALLIAAIVVGVFLLSQIGTDFSYRVWFPEDSEDLRVYDAFEAAHGVDEVLVIGLRSPSGILDPETLTVIEQIDRAMCGLPDILRVDTIANHSVRRVEGDNLETRRLVPMGAEITPEIAEQARRELEGEEGITGYLLNADATYTMLFMSLRPLPPEQKRDYRGIVAGTREIVATYANSGDHTAVIGGATAMGDVFREVAALDARTVGPATIIGCLVILTVVFRRAAGVFLTLIIVALTGALAMAVASALGMDINPQTATIPQILVAIGVADAIHVLTTYRNELRAGASAFAATREALRYNALPTLLTTASTAAGFFGFLAAEVPPIQQTGVIAGVGSMIAWLVSYSLLSLVLPRIRWRERVTVALPGATPENRPISAFSSRLAAWIGKRKFILIAVALVGSVGIGLIAAKNTVNSNPLDLLASTVPLRAAVDELEREVGGVLTLELIVSDGAATEGEASKADISDPDLLRRIGAFEEYLAAQPAVTRVVSVLDPLRAINRAFHEGRPEFDRLPNTREDLQELYFLYELGQPAGMDPFEWITVDKNALRLRVLWTEHDSEKALQHEKVFLQKADSLGLSLIVTGKSQIWNRLSPALLRSFARSLAIAVAFVSLVLAVVLKAPLRAMVAFLPNLVPLLVGGAVLYAMKKPLDVGVLMVFNVCLGIAVDDTIHFTTDYTRFREAGNSPVEATGRVFDHTARALISTTAILVVSFGAFGLASFVPTKFFGVLVACILSFAIAFDLLLLPALLMGIDRDDRKKPANA